MVWAFAGEIWFARVRRDTAEAQEPVQLSDADGRASHPSLAWTGSGFGAVWVLTDDEQFTATLQATAGQFTCPLPPVP